MKELIEKLRTFCNDVELQTIPIKDIHELDEMVNEAPFAVIRCLNGLPSILDRLEKLEAVAEAARELLKGTDIEYGEVDIEPLNKLTDALTALEEEDE